MRLWLEALSARWARRGGGFGRYGTFGEAAEKKRRLLGAPAETKR